MDSPANAVIALLLENWPNTYCFRCLAAKLQVSEKDIRDSVQLQVLASQLHIRRLRCAECGREDDLLQLAK